MTSTQATNFRADGIFLAADDGDDCCYIERLDVNGEGTEEYINIGKCPHHDRKRPFRLALQVADNKLLLPADIHLPLLFEMAEIMRQSELLNTNYNYDTHQTEYNVKPHLGTVDISLIPDVELTLQTDNVE